MMDVRPRLLVIEPETSLAEFLVEQLPAWQVVHDHDSDDRTADAALIASPQTAPDEAERLRQAGMIGPIFTLVDTGQPVPPPLIALTRPLRLSALTARLEDSGSAAVDGAVIGQWRLDASQKILTRADLADGERLTDKEYEVLAMLLGAKGAVSRERIQGQVWNYHAESETHTVETHIWRLRQKLEDDPAAPEHLLTEADGYRLKR